MKNGFYSPSLGSIDEERAIDDIVAFVRQDKDAFYNLAIGTDSHGQDPASVSPDKTVEFVTAVVIHRKGYGGKYFWQKKTVDKITTLRQRIYMETMLSVNFAQNFIPKLKMALTNGEKYDLEIHIDVGEKGETREMIKEVVGIVVGNGFTAKTKPYSYSASNVADKHT
ncbi:ribonuclease H-like YkuK family protein [Candidatus Microgenomates bacterium]|nr:ribonuclease H-like YkuK family protein [Candidatus Microgenomates bacterium]MBI2622144.1 ribonuclease H-like YkuK family protein [Candidatus Microgenomates bacterium]